MSILTIAPTSLGGQDPAYYAGRADAYDEHGTGATLTELITRAEYIGDLHPSTQYALGYTAYITSARLEQDAEDATRRAAIVQTATYWETDR